MAKRPDTQALLAALKGPQDEEDDRPASAVAVEAVAAAAPAAPIVAAVLPTPDTASPAKAARPGKASSRTKIKAPRSELKHFGGYLDDDSMEMVALLRIRLKLENSDLIKLAIEELYKRHNAKRAFGDV